MLTCGLSRPKALKALFAKLVAVAIVDRGRREMEGRKMEWSVKNPGSGRGLIKSATQPPSLSVTLLGG